MKKGIKIFYGMYLSIGLFFLCAMFNLTELGLAAKVIVTGLFVWFLFSGDDFRLEKDILAIIAMVYNFGLLIDERIPEQYKWLNYICIFTVIAATAFYFLTRKGSLLLIQKWFGRNWIVLLMILFFAGMSIDALGAWSMWDSRVYYSFPYGDNDIHALINNFDADFTKFGNLFLASHVSVGYSLWILLFQMFEQSIELVRIANIVLAGISIYAYYQIVKKLLGKRHSEKVLILSVVPYAVSPFVLGMFGGIDVDAAGMYFAVIFIACSLYHYECLELVVATCFCLTKEPNVIYYICYVIAKIICSYCLTHKFNLITLVQYGFGKVKHYVYMLPVLIWGILYNYKGWGKNASGTMHTFGINPIYSIMKLKQIFLLNFNWIFWCTILVGVLIWVLKRIHADKEIMIGIVPIIVLGISVIGFGCAYVTCTHVRYIVILIPMLYLSTVCIAGRLNSKFFSCWSGLIALLLLIQSFYVIDPIMAVSFPSMSVGDVKIYSMYEYGNMQFHDSIVYNRQYLYWQKALGITLNRAGYTGDMVIVLPDDSNCSRYNLFGDHVSVWNNESKKLEYYDEHKDNFDADLKITKVDGAKKGNYSEYEKWLYIIPEWGTVDDEFTEGFDIQKMDEVRYRGYHIRYMAMTVK